MSDKPLEIIPSVKAALKSVWAWRVYAMLAGAVAATALHFALYRVELPLKPFIYVAF